MGSKQTDGRPDPLIPGEIDLRDFAFMPLDVVRLRDSDLAATGDGEGFRCAVLLWCAAWHQLPAGSLPPEDPLLARLAGLGRDAEAWGRVRAVALHGFVECSDGRLYHPVICQKAEEAWAKKAGAKRAAAVRWAAKRPRVNGKADHAPAAPPHIRTDQRPHSDRNANGYANAMQGEDRTETGTTSSASSLGRANPPRPREAGGAALQQVERKQRPEGWSASILERCLEAAGLSRDAAASGPALQSIAPIVALLDEGYDLDADVLPVIRSRAKPGVRSWAFFVPAIVEAREGSRESIAKARANGHANGSIPTFPSESDEAKWRVRISHYRKTGKWLTTLAGERHDAPQWVRDELAAIDAELAKPAPAAQPLA